uniref:Uncharacterized protein n=1 Tax=Sipha flava TaxID=143950 RepID=A0A2S2QLE2_9HEMI
MPPPTGLRQTIARAGRGFHSNRRAELLRLIFADSSDSAFRRSSEQPTSQPSSRTYPRRGSDRSAPRERYSGSAFFLFFLIVIVVIIFSRSHPLCCRAHVYRVPHCPGMAFAHCATPRIVQSQRAPAAVPGTINSYCARDKKKKKPPVLCARDETPTGSRTPSRPVPRVRKEKKKKKPRVYVFFFFTVTRCVAGGNALVRAVGKTRLRRSRNRRRRQ